MAEKDFISVVVPFYNEAGQVAHSLETIANVLIEEDIRFEILAIDDGSTDATWEELLTLKKIHDRYRFIRLSRNFGKEAAITAGLDLAKGDAVIVMDGDLQHPPRYIPKMLRLWREGFDVVEGVKEKRGDTFFLSRIAANVFYKLFRKMSGIELKNASDFKLLDRKVVDSWKTIPEKDTFFRALSVWMGFRRSSFLFEVDERPVGKSKWGFRKLFRLSVNALTGFSSRPLLLISSMGAVFLVVFFILAIQTLVHYLRGVAATGFTTVILLQLLIGSIILISLGLIGIYIDSLFREVKARPRYFIADMTESPSKDEG